MISVLQFTKFIKCTIHIIFYKQLIRDESSAFISSCLISQMPLRRMYSKAEPSIFTKSLLIKKNVVRQHRLQHHFFCIAMICEFGHCSVSSHKCLTSHLKPNKIQITINILLQWLRNYHIFNHRITSITNHILDRLIRYLILKWYCIAFSPHCYIGVAFFSLSSILKPYHISVLP